MSIVYDATAPHARLSGAKSVTLVSGHEYTGRFEYQMERIAQGKWSSQVLLRGAPFYTLFYFEDEEGRVDNNGGQYWDVLTCIGGQKYLEDIRSQALSYTGEMFAPGFLRRPDPGKAIRILKSAIARNPQADIPLAPTLWNVEYLREKLELRTAAGLFRDIEAFLDRHPDDSAAIELAISSIVASGLERPPILIEKIRRLAKMQGHGSEMALINFDIADARAHKEPNQQVDALLEVAISHPDTPFATDALTLAFDSAVKEGSAALAEKVFDCWIELRPDSADARAALAYFYVRNKINLDRAIRLLQQAGDLLERSSSMDEHSPPTRWVLLGPNVARNRQKNLTLLHYWRGRALVALKQFSAAVPELHAAIEHMPLQDGTAQLALADALAGTGDAAIAAATYVEAATAPAISPSDRETALASLHAIYLQGRLGTEEDADARIAKRMTERHRQTASRYAPVVVARASPRFSFITSSGKRVNLRSLRGFSVVLNFWATWCAPCITELLRLQEFANSHRQVKVFAIATMSEREQVRALIIQRGIDSLEIALSDKTARAFGDLGIPSTVVLDAHGQLRIVHVGDIDDIGAILEKDLAAIDDR